MKQEQHRAKGELLADEDVLKQEAERSLARICMTQHLDWNQKRDLDQLREILERMGAEATPPLDLPALWQAAPA